MRARNLRYGPGRLGSVAVDSAVSSGRPSDAPASDTPFTLAVTLRRSAGFRGFCHGSRGDSSHRDVALITRRLPSPPGPFPLMTAGNKRKGTGIPGGHTCFVRPTSAGDEGTQMDGTTVCYPLALSLLGAEGVEL